jgi:hypothetical protein
MLLSLVTLTEALCGQKNLFLSIDKVQRCTDQSSGDQQIYLICIENELEVLEHDESNKLDSFNYEIFPDDGNKSTNCADCGED